MRKVEAPFIQIETFDEANKKYCMHATNWETENGCKECNQILSQVFNILFSELWDMIK
jgi:hypothetical protein